MLYRHGRMCANNQNNRSSTLHWQRKCYKLNTTPLLNQQQHQYSIREPNKQNPHENIVDYYTLAPILTLLNTALFAQIYCTCYLSSLNVSIHFCVVPTSDTFYQIIDSHAISTYCSMYSLDGTPVQLDGQCWMDKQQYFNCYKKYK